MTVLLKKIVGLWCLIAVVISGFILTEKGWASSKDIFFHEMEGNYDNLIDERIPGKSYYRNEYDGGTSVIQDEQYDVEYVFGNLPIIISVPHGGYSEPGGINNNNSTGYPDRETIQIANELFLKIHKLTGGYPHIVMNRLHREKLDMNRYYGDSECMEDDNPGSRTRNAWDDFHFFIDEAKRQSIENYGFGFFVDLHGQSSHPYIQLGYGVSKTSLIYNLKSGINDFVLRSSLTYTSGKNGIDLFDLLFGRDGLGEILYEKALDSDIPDNDSEVYPSDSHDTIAGAYYSGHYNVYRHCGMNTADQYSRIYPILSSSSIQDMVDEYDSEFYDASFYTADGVSKISGTIVELNERVRIDHKEKICLAIADALLEYIEFHYDVSLSVAPDTVTVLDEDFETKSSVGDWQGEWNRTKEEASYGNYSLMADDDNQGDLTSPALNCENASEITVSFNYRKHNLGDDDLSLYFGSDGEFREIPVKIEGQGANDGWIFYSVTTKNSRYFTDDFQVRFHTDSLSNSLFEKECLYIDSVHVMKKAPADDTPENRWWFLNPYEVFRRLFNILT